MALRKQPCAFLFLFALSTLLLFIINSSNAADFVGSGAISTYWGQHSDDATEGSLTEACDTGRYDILILEYLIVFDDGKIPILNLANHCGSEEHPCSELESQIKHCQAVGIKVFLSIGQDKLTKPTTTNRDSKIPASSSEDVSVAKDLADYLLENFLSGNPGPLGSVSLDGIDIADVGDTQHLHWDELVKAINESTTERKIYLSASPECVYPDHWLDTAIQTGLFDYIWVEFFYQNPCIYSAGSAANLLKAWKTWTTSDQQQNILGAYSF